MSEKINNDMDVDDGFLRNYYSKVLERNEGANSRVWSQANYYTTIILSLLTIAIILYFQYALYIIENPLTVIILIIPPGGAFLIILIAIKSNKKQFEIIYKNTAILSKIEGKYRLDAVYNGIVLSGDDYWLPKGYATIAKQNDSTTEDFIKENLNDSTNVGYTINLLYYVLLSIAIIEIIAFVVITMI
ncbi:hypothetical protein C5S31_04100 [ANME-1 cluster archaeon GoMg2]|nr:hypothetical protein [ANME-1 cluster archaeon GoMg2]